VLLIGNVHYRQYALTRHRIRADDGNGLSSRATVFLLSRTSPFIRGAQELAVCEVDPLEFLEAIRECRLGRDLDMAVRLACSPFGDKYAVNPRG
jgi:hypothetical protein